MKMRQVIVAAFASTLSLAALPVFAHHSASMFNPAKTVTVTGTVKEFQYTNPHSWLIVDVSGSSGHVTEWAFEAEGPAMLLRAGILRTDLSPGTQVTVTGHPMRDGRPAATWMKAVRMSDGKVFDPMAKVK